MNTVIHWHPATESPGKKAILVAFKYIDGYNHHLNFEYLRFRSSGIIPAECKFKTPSGYEKLAVAWAFYDEVTKGITSQMIEDAKYAAWAWLP